jgi:predicted O-methyltransferase YrrM
MLDTDNLKLPSVLHGITATTEALELTMAADLLLGSLLRTLAASKPDGRFLQLGTGSGIATAWLLDGMTPGAALVSVDSNSDMTEHAQRFLGNNPRLTLHNTDPLQLLNDAAQLRDRFDLIVATGQQGEALLDAASDVLAPGGILVASGLAGEGASASEKAVLDSVTASLERNTSLIVTKLNWSSGIILAVRSAA